MPSRVRTPIFSPNPVIVTLHEPRSGAFRTPMFSGKFALRAGAGAADNGLKVPIGSTAKMMWSIMAVVPDRKRDCSKSHRYLPLRSCR
jgi:hypothetical protein